MPTKLLHKGLTAPAKATPKRQVKVNPEGIVEAIVAVTGVVDAVGDLIVPGAFTHTLTVRRPKVVDDHEWGRKVGRVLHVEEWLPGDRRLPKRTKDGKPWPAEAGALVATMQYNLNAERGREAYEWVRFYTESNECEFSIGYKVPDGKARIRRDQVRVILMVDLFEFSHVLFGAAPLSMALSVKSMHSEAGGRVHRPALLRTDDEETEDDYDDVDHHPDRPWDDEDKPKKPEKPRKPVEGKTAHDALMEAKDGGGDRNRGNAEQLRQYWAHGEGAAQIGWGSPGDFNRCVSLVSEHMGVEDAKGYCNLRHHEALGFYPATHAKMEGKTAEGKAHGRMRGSYEERIAQLEHGARNLLARTLNVEQEDLAVLSVATYGHEAVLRAYGPGIDGDSYLIGYSTDPESGDVELGEPQKVELSLVAEPDDDRDAPKVVDDETVEEITVVQPTMDALSFAEGVMRRLEEKSAHRVMDRLASILDGMEGKRDLTAEQRKKKPTMPGSDDRFPIGDKEDLRAAIQSYGRTKDEDEDKAKRWICRRARELDATNLLPDSWTASTKDAQSDDPKDPAVRDGQVEADDDTITKDTLPEGEWAEYAKTGTIQAMRMGRPFTVQTREGVVEGEDGDWLATDSGGYPYPIAADEFEAVYDPLNTDDDAETGLDDEEPADDQDLEPADTETVEPADDQDLDPMPDDPGAPTEQYDDTDTEPDDTVTLDPDEHFATLDALDTDTPTEDDDEEAA